jgi:hypothetical protein
VRLSPDEALVLYHFLLRYTTRGEREIEHTGEQRVLDKVCLALCDKLEAEVSAPDYEARVAGAQERVSEALRRAAQSEGE